MTRKDAGAQHYAVAPLAGVSAGAVAVLVGGGLILIAARRQLGELATVVMWALMVAVVGAVLYALVYGFLWLRHRVRHPETLAGRPVVRAEVVDETPQAVTAAEPLAIEPPRVYLTDAQFAALMVTNPQLPRGDQDRRSG